MNDSVFEHVGVPYSLKSLGTLLEEDEKQMYFLQQQEKREKYNVFMSLIATIISLISLIFSVFD